MPEMMQFVEAKRDVYYNVKWEICMWKYRETKLDYSFSRVY